MKNYENTEKNEKVIMLDGHLESYEDALEWDHD